MGKILMCGTSGGVASDDITAKREDIIAGKTAITADSNDEIVEGTLPDHKDTVNAVVVGMASNGTHYNMHCPKGAYRRTDLGDNGGAGVITTPLAELRRTIGYTNPAKVLSDTTIAGQAGTIPIQGGSTIVPGTGNKTAIGGGRYASGNIIVSGDPNLIPANIKKGTRIFGVNGTHDGFVPGPMDIYNRGTWGAGYGTASVSTINNNGTISFNVNHIYNKHYKNGVANGFNVRITNQGNSFNLQPYSTVNVVYRTDESDSALCVCLVLMQSPEIIAYGVASQQERTISLNISSFNGTAMIQLYSTYNNMPGGVSIYRIYFT